MARPVDQLSQEQKEGEVDLTPKKVAARPTNAEQEEWSSYDQLQHTLSTHNGEGCSYALQCNAAQFPVTLRQAISSLYAANHSLPHPHQVGGHQREAARPRIWWSHLRHQGEPASETPFVRIAPLTPRPTLRLLPNQKPEDTNKDRTKKSEEGKELNTASNWRMLATAGG